MIDRLDDFLKLNTEALKLRAYRQSVIAGNIANADTPGYKAVDFDFTRALDEAVGRRGAASAPELLYRRPVQDALDGNSVEMDAERARFADNSVRYEAALKMLNAQIRSMLAAMQG
ncbi:MAG: flagellar basal body rod protein FlgB [Burkholderiales bacterium]|nr:flagellar basal body rod protein FlgB [Burkholderiales bacterium]MCC7116669.1 flagellar basal body rod protein FlgB [Burkholderiales bacterium]